MVVNTVISKYNTKKDIQQNKELKALYDKTHEIYNDMIFRNQKAKCVYCLREYNISNFPTCKGCKKPNLLHKFGFADSGLIKRHDSIDRRY